jgi:hypothetical protein
MAIQALLTKVFQGPPSQTPNYAAKHQRYECQARLGFGRNGNKGIHAVWD